MHLGAVRRHGSPHPTATERRRQCDGALHNEEGSSAGPADVMLMHFAVGKRVGRELEDGIPQRTRAQQRAVWHLHLPIQAAERLLESWFGRLTRQLEAPIARTLEPAHKLPQVGFELDGHAPLDMALEQEEQAERRHQERRDDRSGACRKQTDFE
jgi:hypothetical protein